MAADTKKVIIGLAEVALGAPATDGGMGTTLSPLGYTLIDTCQLTFDDDTVNDFNVEELDYAFFSQRIKGNINVAFSVANPSLNALLEVCGGTITGTGDAAVWNAPNNAPTIELSLKITPKQGFIFSFPRVSISAKMSQTVGKNQLTTLDVTGKALVPLKDGEAIFSLSQIPDPTA
jgi:hypothetical protein